MFIFVMAQMTASDKKLLQIIIRYYYHSESPTAIVRELGVTLRRNAVSAESSV